jgi:hypothetical protein
MKKILIAAMTILTMNVQAGTIIHVPYPSHQELFNGTISRIEPQIKAALVQKAIEVCQTQENIAAISNVEAKFSFDVIELKNPIFRGSYPLASASAVVDCRQSF